MTTLVLCGLTNVFGFAALPRKHPSMATFKVIVTKISVPDDLATPGNTCGYCQVHFDNARLIVLLEITRVLTTEGSKHILSCYSVRNAKGDEQLMCLFMQIHLIAENV